MELNYKRIGYRIKTVRKKRCISQEILAEQVNLSTPYISHIERAVKHASLETIVKIADSLEVTVDQLLYGNQKNNRCEYEPEFAELLSDCSSYEKCIIFNTVSAIKNSLRANKDLFFKSKR